MKHLLVLLLMSSFAFGQTEEDPEQYDQQIKYSSLSELCDCTSYVEALSTLFDLQHDFVRKEIKNLTTVFVETVKLSGYEYKPGDDLLNKKIYFNKSGYIIPYDCVLNTIKGNKTSVKN